MSTDSTQYTDGQTVSPTVRALHVLRWEARQGGDDPLAALMYPRHVITETIDHIDSLESTNTALLEALEGDEALISTCQSVLTNYMVPDGICADEAIADLISLLDGPQQREIQGASKSAIKAARGAS